MDEAGPELSVIVPALDEAAALPGLLEALRAQVGVRLEVVVADGGSRDGSAALAEAQGARVVRTSRGRAIQMNAGAACARAPLLLFLHADSGLPVRHLLREALRALRTEQVEDARVAGHFPLRFIDRGSRHRLLYRVLEAKTATNRPDSIHGDQALLISRAWFTELGGFDERLPFLEDESMAARIFAAGRWIVLPGELQTSARRFEREGTYRRYTLMAVMMGMHAAGLDEFFQRAPAVYAAQAEATRLSPGPYLSLVRRLMREAGWRGAARIAVRVGGYVRRQSWQPFLWLDVAAARPLLGASRSPFLRLHDRVVEPLIDHRAADVFTAACVTLWFLVLLPAGYTVVDRRSR
jgi:rSAM/selenodomain-associated transferase 2